MAAKIHEERKPDFFDRVEAAANALLTRRKRIKREKREKQARKNALLDWLEAFLWAAGVVLLINQYLVQAYQIPSGSMIDTLLIHDRIFVNKLIYGPELLPGLGKLRSPVRPERNNVIIFESPQYISRGTLFDIAQRVIYMLSFSLVDIDKDALGRPQAHFLIKRAAAMGGDRVYNREGEMQLLFDGEERAVSERAYNAARGWTHSIRRLASPAGYDALKAGLKADMWIRLGLSPPQGLDIPSPSAEPQRMENETREAWRLELERLKAPHDDLLRRHSYKLSQGWYVPPGRVLPLGDNRDFSHDGRAFGPVKESKILGRGLFIYWPGSDIEDSGPYAARLDPPPQKRGLGRLGAIR
jgi:signal peptidase I